MDSSIHPGPDSENGIHADGGGTIPDRSVVLANQLRPIVLHLSRWLRRELHSLGVGASQVSILAAIRDFPGIGVADLATREAVSSPSMSAHVERLCTAGLVTKDQEGTDRRRRGLRLTPEGGRVLRAIRSRRTAWLATRIESLSAEEYEQLQGAISALAALVPE